MERQADHQSHGYLAGQSLHVSAEINYLGSLVKGWGRIESQPEEQVLLNQ